jgi:transcription antitermination factor NusG
MNMKEASVFIGRVDLKNPATIQEAANEALGLCGLKVGSKVAVLDDPTWPYAGQAGVVTEIDENSGTSKVKMANGIIVNLMTNQLIGL